MFPIIRLEPFEIPFNDNGCQRQPLTVYPLTGNSLFSYVFSCFLPFFKVFFLILFFCWKFFGWSHDSFLLLSFLCFTFLHCLFFLPFYLSCPFSLSFFVFVPLFSIFFLPFCFVFCLSVWHCFLTNRKQSNSIVCCVVSSNWNETFATNIVPQMAILDALQSHLISLLVLPNLLLRLKTWVFFISFSLSLSLRSRLSRIVFSIFQTVNCVFDLPNHFFSFNSFFFVFYL